MWPNGTKQRLIIVKYDSKTSSLDTWGDISDGVSDVFLHTLLLLLISTISLLILDYYSPIFFRLIPF